MTDKATPTAREALEFRPRENGEFDEIVARFANGMVHVETMSGTSCYVGFYWDDGRICQWYINSARKLTYHHEVSYDKPTQGEATDASALAAELERLATEGWYVPGESHPVLSAAADAWIKRVTPLMLQAANRLTALGAKP